MGKTLINHLGKRAKKGIFLLATALSLMGCPPINNISYPPTAELSSSESSIKKGKSVSLTLNGEDKTGDISDYKIGIDKNSNNKIDSGEELVEQSSPIANYSWTPDYTGRIKLIGQCTNTQGLTGATDLEILVSEPDPIEPPINPPVEPPINPKMPTVNFSGINTNLIDGKSKIIDLPIPTDEDTSNVPYNDVRVLSGNLTLDKSRLSERKLTLNANSVSQDSPYQLEFDFGSEEGGKNTATISGTIKNLCNVSGFLQDNETHTNQSGEIKLSDGTPTSTSGAFNVQASSPADEIKLQGKFGNSYVRTITLDGKRDYSDVYVRAVPAPSFGASQEEFKEFLRTINETYDGIEKWDLNNLKGIEILSKNPITGDEFTVSQIELIKNRIKNSSEIEVFVRGKELDSYIRENEGNYNNSLTPNEGWIIIVPYNFTDGTCGITSNGSTNGLINRTKIRINPISTGLGNPTISHEFGHAFIAPTYPGHAKNTFSNYTIMSEDFPLQSPGLADAKAGKVIYEETYLPREKLDDILGIGWQN